MPVEEILEVQFLGDAGDLDKAANKGVAAFLRFEKASESAGDSMSDLQKKFKAFGSLKPFKPPVLPIPPPVPASYDHFRKRIEETTAAVAKSKTNFTGLSRVIQDLPFGFVAISNNLEQLLPAAGAAGLAMSGLVSILTFASVGFGAWTRGLTGATESAEEHAKAVKAAQQALQDYVTNLDDISRIRVQGEQQAQAEIISLKTLYDATQNQNIAIGKRKQLVDELQEQYPKYFGNIKDEIILAGGAKNAYDRLTVAILAASRARAAEKELDELQQQRRVIEEQQTKNLQKQSDLFQKLKSLRGDKLLSAGIVPKDEEQGSLKLILSLLEIGERTSAVTDAQDEYNTALKEYNKIQAQNASLTNRVLAITKELQDTVQENPDALLNPTGNLPKAPKVKVKKVKVEPREVLLPLDNVEKITPTSRLGTANLPKVKLDIPVEIRLIVDKQEAFRQKVEEFTKRVNDAVVSAKEGLAIGIGQGLGDIFSGRGFSSIFKNIASVVGDFISQLGQMLIKASIAAAAFKKAFAALLANPIAAIGVGVGLVAIGQLIKNLALPKARGFAAGGVVSGSVFANVGEGIGTSKSNPEIIAPLDKLKNIIGGQTSFPAFLPVHEISGDTLRLWYKRANDTGRMFG